MAVPAFATKTSSRPKSVTICCMVSRTASESVISTLYALARTPCSLTISSACCIAAGFLSSLASILILNSHILVWQWKCQPRRLQRRARLVSIGNNVAQASISLSPTNCTIDTHLHLLQRRTVPLRVQGLSLLQSHNRSCPSERIGVAHFLDGQASA